MFNPSTPNNQLPLLPGNFDYHNKDIYIKALEAQKALAKLNGLLHLLPNANILITPLITAESVSSSAIENINTTTIEVLKAQALPEDFRT
jgi:Fic family protein